MRSSKIRQAVHELELGDKNIPDYMIEINELKKRRRQL